ncbi:hypothetical protein GS597_19550 [Synechococcales cyanobacterium C]|uniref:Uncharacterized protein n=1 Tax=Petrachloros mirabilis ULC683 TaxID=2781853 RepID=A0A8K2AA13_9CYAN|nr:hypothetical protein [Petrachloros mirabilis]NCJ08660.1 hypothetical protein [Petrachloros mirabilis ULC683]
MHSLSAKTISIFGHALVLTLMLMLMSWSANRDGAVTQDPSTRIDSALTLAQRLF